MVSGHYCSSGRTPHGQEEVQWSSRWNVALWRRLTVSQRSLKGGCDSPNSARCRVIAVADVLYLVKMIQANAH